MSEQILVVDHQKLTYEGLFNAAEVYNIVSSWFFDRNWDWIENLNEEQVTPDGKQVRIYLQPWKSISTFYKLTMNIKLHMHNIREVEVEHEGKKVNLHQGMIQITVDGHVHADRQDEMVGRPFFWFLTIMMHKYFYKTYQSKASDWIRSDVDDMLNMLKNYLNNYKYSYRY